MIRFLDGPAEGQVLMLRRAPVFLRVVRSARGGWDALDQLADTPRPGEAVTAYRKVPGTGGWVHLCCRGRGAKHAGGRFMTGDYRVVADQPPDDVLRDTARWRAWATEQVAALTAGAEG